MAKSISSLFGEMQRAQMEAEEADEAEATSEEESEQSELPLEDEAPRPVTPAAHGVQETLETADLYMDMELMAVPEEEPVEEPERLTLAERDPGVPLGDDQGGDVISLDDELGDDVDVAAIVEQASEEGDPWEESGDPDAGAEPEAEAEIEVAAEAEPEAEAEVEVAAEAEPEAETEAEPDAQEVEEVDIAAAPGDEWADPWTDASADEPEDAAPEVHADSAPSADDAVRSMMEAVDAYLAAGFAHREEAARRVREEGTRLRDLGVVDATADAVERLALAAEGDAGLDASVALAQLLTSARVAGLIARRLGAARREEQRNELIAVASRLGQPMALALGDALSDTDDRSSRRAYMEALVALGSDGMEVVAAMVSDPRWFVARNAVLILGQAGGERAVQHLTTTLSHDDARVRKETLLALAKIGGDDAATLVYGKLEDSNDDVRAAAAMAAGALANLLPVEKAQRPLMALLDKESNTEVQVAVLQALGQIGDPGAVNQIEKRAVTSFLSRPPTEVRIAAYRALAAIGTPHAMQVLEAAADDKDVAVKSTVKGLLRET
ncbi:MAG TPA: HEAT repeat domain-containing protein [Longimicrobiales bacterium]